jgi:predicted nucleotidyltransferase
VKELAVFGSATRGDMRPDSDIDILVEFQSSARIGIIKFASLRVGAKLTSQSRCKGVVPFRQCVAVFETE